MSPLVLLSTLLPPSVTVTLKSEVATAVRWFRMPPTENEYTVEEAGGDPPKFFVTATVEAVTAHVPPVRSPVRAQEV